MPEIRRNVGDANYTNFINPGVADSSAATALVGVAKAAMDIDTTLAKRRLENEIEGIRTQRIAGSDSVISLQEEILGPEQNLSEADRSQVDNLGGKLGQLEQARRQGRMTDEWMKIRAERAVRQAIARRPGLAQEFRSIAAQSLGSDVVGATVEILAQMDRAQAAGADAQARAQEKIVEEMRKELKEGLGIHTLEMSGAQVAALYGRKLSELNAVSQAEAGKRVFENAAAMQEAGLKLNRPQATAQFINEAVLIKQQVMAGIQPLVDAMTNPANSKEDKAATLAATQAQLQSRLDQLDALAARGDVDPTAVESQKASLKTVHDTLVKFATGVTSGELTDLQIKSLKSIAEETLLNSSPDAPILIKAAELFPDVFPQFYGPNGEFNSEVPLAIGNALLNTGDPRTSARTSGETIGGLVGVVLQPKNRDNPDYAQRKEGLVQAASKAVESFMLIPDKDFRVREFSGAQGAVGKLKLHLGELKEQLDQEQKDAIAVPLAGSANSAIRVLKAQLFQRYPSLKGKVVDELDPETGQLFHPLATDAEGKEVVLSPAEESALALYNQSFGGKALLQVLGGLSSYTGGDEGLEGRQKAVELIYGQASFSEGALEAARKASKPRVAPFSGGGSSQGGGTPPTGSQRRWYQTPPPGGL